MTAAARPGAPLAAMLCVALLAASCAAHDTRGAPAAAAARRLLQDTPSVSTTHLSSSADLSFERSGRGLLAAGTGSAHAVTTASTARRRLTGNFGGPPPEAPTAGWLSSTSIRRRGPARKPGASLYTRKRPLLATGGRAKAWCFRIHAEASLSHGGLSCWGSPVNQSAWATNSLSKHAANTPSLPDLTVFRGHFGTLLWGAGSRHRSVSSWILHRYTLEAARRDYVARDRASL